MELTYRQKAFLNTFLDDYRNIHGPVHYSVIAKQLGLNNSTAYYMLRLLEEKGLVTSQYDTPKETAGPGRSGIRFAPTAEAIELVAHLPEGIREQQEWDDVKTRILNRLANGDAYQEILNELLARMYEPRSSLVRCAEVISALMINLRKTRQEFAEPSSVDSLLKAPASKLRMSILVGFVLGLSYADHRRQRLRREHQNYAEKYEASLQELSHDSLLKLHRFTRDVWKILKASTQ